MDKLLSHIRPSTNWLPQVREFRSSNFLSSMRNHLNPAEWFAPVWKNRPEVTTTQLAVTGALGGLAFYLLHRRRQNSIPLSPIGKAVFVTGCDSGFGKAAALEFHRNGFVVFAGCLFAETAKETTFSELPSATFYVVQLDVTDQGQIDSAVHVVDEWLQANPEYRLWCLLSNAGISTFGPVEVVSIETFQRVMNCNFFGAVRVSKSFLPLMRKTATTDQNKISEGGGRLIFLGSIGGHLPSPSNGAYGCTKAAGLFLADTLAMELDRFKIRVSVIMPDFYRTGIMEPNQSLAALNREFDQTDPNTLQQYGGEPFMERLRKFLTVVSPPRAKDDLTPVVRAIIDAASSKKPRRCYYPMEVPTKIATILYDFAPMVYLSLMKHFI